MNPLIEEIMQAYLKTHMTDQQFETLVTKAIDDSKGGANPAELQEQYDKGFSDGYDTARAEIEFRAAVTSPAPFVYEDK
jgi:hypothetical protein